jgi:hypothetical protein
LAVGRVKALNADEQAAIAAASVTALMAAWGGPTPGAGRDLELDLQLTQIGLLASEIQVHQHPTVIRVHARRVDPPPMSIELYECVLR